MAKVRPVERSDAPDKRGGPPYKRVGWLIHCPGCGYGHLFNVEEPGGSNGQQKWTFNYNEDAPTFQPSMLVNQNGPNRCHSFVTDGNIQFLSDCFHKLAGQTVPLPHIDEHWDVIDQ